MHFVRHLLLAGVVACSLQVEPARAAIPDAEMQVLSDFYTSTGGDNWLATKADIQRWFAPGTDPCTWFGVGCDAAHEHVIGFDLSGGNLAGSLPGNLASLKHLRYLVVDNNRLSGPLPSLTGLTDLQAVFAQSNQLTGPIPSLANLPSLGYFAVDHNQLSGHIPHSVSELPQLQYFVVDHNQLSGRVPRAPPTLSQFSAELCPNLLDIRPSADATIDGGWNLATGQTPWWSADSFGCTGNSADADTRHAFATSALGTGDMHSWDDVANTNLAGLAAADGVCQVRATAANLFNPGDYVAWLSDRNNDAYCRVFGLSGKKDNSCGLPLAPPVGAGPWLRTDDVPFAATVENALADNRVYSSLNIDEFGDRFFNSDLPFTATDIDGAFSTNTGIDADCARWSSSDPLASLPELGSSVSSAGNWTFNNSGAGCNSKHRLVCMQKGSGPDLVGHGQLGHREAFVTSATVTGNLGGIAGADATCRALATSANLYAPNSFKALLASSAPAANLTNRIEFDGPWYRRDGLLFAHDKAELIGGAVTLPLNVTEFGDYLGISVALTGASKLGFATGQDCAAWTSTGAPMATSALVNSISLFDSNGTNWLSGADVSCAAAQPEDWQHHLFCVSDSDVIYHAEFEALPPAP